MKYLCLVSLLVILSGCYNSNDYDHATSTISFVGQCIEGDFSTYAQCRVTTDRYGNFTVRSPIMVGDRIYLIKPKYSTQWNIDNRRQYLGLDN